MSYRAIGDDGTTEQGQCGDDEYAAVVDGVYGCKCRSGAWYDASGKCGIYGPEQTVSSSAVSSTRPSYSAASSAGGSAGGIGMVGAVLVLGVVGVIAYNFL